MKLIKVVPPLALSCAAAVLLYTTFSEPHVEPMSATREQLGETAETPPPVQKVLSDEGRARGGEDGPRGQPSIKSVSREELAGYQQRISQPLDVEADIPPPEYRPEPREIGEFIDVDSPTSAVTEARGKPRNIGEPMNVEANPGLIGPYRDPISIGEPLNADAPPAYYQPGRERRSIGQPMAVDD